MHKDYAWPKTIMIALDHYLAFLSMKCNQARPRQSETRDTLIQLREEVVKGYKIEDTDQRKKQQADKKRKDTARMSNWPATELIKKVVQQAMVDLEYIVARYTGDKAQLAAMNKLLIGIIQYNEYAGRTKEWAILSAAHVKAQFDKGKHILICQEHKTAEIYGDVGKYLSPGTKKAMEVYDSAFQGEHARKDDLFFQPCSGKHINISYYLRRFGEEGFPDIPEALNSNLLRKKLTSTIDKHAKRNQCFQMMKAYDKHGEATMKRTYVCESAEEDAEYGEYMFKEVYGEPVPWPTEEEMQQLMRKLVEDVVPAKEDEEQAEEDEKVEEEGGEEAESEAGTPTPSDNSEPAAAEDMITEADVRESLQAEAQLENEAASIAITEADVLESMQAEAELGNTASSSGLNGAAAFALPVAPLEVGDIVGDGRAEDELESLDGPTFSAMMLQATLNDWTEDDSLELAAAKAKHIAETDTAVRVFARAKPPMSRDIGEMIKSIKHAHREPLQWQESREVAAAPTPPPVIQPVEPTPPPQIQPAAPKAPAGGKSHGKGRAKGVSKGKTQVEREHYATYNPTALEAGLGVVKHNVSHEAHAWMEEQLKAWQQENGAKIGDRPIPNKWYWDKRIECIDAGLVTIDHSWDVVRSWLTTFAKRQSSYDVD